jgi:hypothetical protein
VAFGRGRGAAQQGQYLAGGPAGAWPRALWRSGRGVRRCGSRSKAVGWSKRHQTGTPDSARAWEEVWTHLQRLLPQPLHAAAACPPAPLASAAATAAAEARGVQPQTLCKTLGVGALIGGVRGGWRARLWGAPQPWPTHTRQMQLQATGVLCHHGRGRDRCTA